MTLLAIQGYYGYGNLGDDLMLYLLMEQLQQAAPSLRFRVLLHRDADPSLVETPPGVEAETRKVGGWRQRLDAVSDASCLVFGGGTCLHRLGFCGLYNNLAAKLLGVPVVWLGVGADDVGAGKTRWKAKLSLATCRAASWRDAPSRDLAADLLPRFAESMIADDLAFAILRSRSLQPLLQLQEGESAEGGRISAASSRKNAPLVVGWRCFSSYLTPAEETRALECGADAIAAATGGRRSVDVIDIADLVDNVQNAQLAAALKRRGVQVRHREGLSLAEKLQAIRGASGGIFARLHGLVLAQLFGIPSVAVSYASKLDNFGRLFHQPPVVPLPDLQESGDALARAFKEQLISPSHWKTPVAEHADNALGHMDIVKRLLGECVSWEERSARSAA